MQPRSQVDCWCSFVLPLFLIFGLATSRIKDSGPARSRLKRGQLGCHGRGSRHHVSRTTDCCSCLPASTTVRLKDQLRCLAKRNG
ncbi:hypothetical protein F4803DRAFT_522726 [Xylaria telfairii]|nr:hypothetical protein F4803DRAFT_522726 [Xylaria telfairii]